MIVVAAQQLIEAVGIRPCSTSASGLSVTYTVANSAPIPAGTVIRIQLANIINPILPTGGYQVTIITKDSNNNIIDGPTQNSPYAEKQIGTSQIADGAVTEAKIGQDEINVGWIDNTPANYRGNMIL